MKEIRVEKQFMSVDEVVAASGLKISATGLENVIAGVPIIAARDEKDIDAIVKDVQKEIEEVEIKTDGWVSS